MSIVPRSPSAAAREERLVGERVEGSRSAGGAVTTICFRVIIAEVRALTAVRRATLRWRIISTAPSAVFGIAVDWPARTDRAAVSASTVSDLPAAIRRVRRSPRFTSSDLVPGSPDRARESRPVAAGALDAERGDHVRGSRPR